MHRPKHNIGFIVHSLLRQRLGHARVGLGVRRFVADLATQNAATGIDLLDRQLDAVVEVGAWRGASA